jgi:phosphoglycolate phosphatase
MSGVFASSGERCGWPEAILFDLDGTLIDSAADIAAAVNELLAQDKLGPLSLAAVRGMIGKGVVNLVARAYEACDRPLEGSALEDAVARMMPCYARHLTNLTVVLPGALETVAALANARVKIAVVSNKPHEFTTAIVDHYGFGAHASVVLGAQDGLAKKPAPDMLLKAMKKLETRPRRGLMVGDSISDVEAARAAGMAVIIIEGGYTMASAAALRPDGVAKDFHALSAAIEQLKAQR